MLGEEIGMQKWKLNCIRDLFNLRVEATDIGIGNIGNLLQQQMLDFGLIKFLKQQIGRRVQPQQIS